MLAILITCAGFTVALTYAPCYATVCPEEHFGLQTRIHIGIYYGLLATIGLALGLRAYSARITAITSFVVIHRRLPVFGKYPTIGGVLLTLWIVGVTGVTAALWHGAEKEFWISRVAPLHWYEARARLTATGIWAHFADILLGLLVIPVSRHSLPGRLFGAHQASLLFAHKLLAYFAITAAIGHGAAYMAFLATYDATKDASKKGAFSVRNPVYSVAQAQQMNSWYQATLPTGALTLASFLVMAITSLPAVRRRNYNTFYYTHISCGSVIFFTACIHSSTNFYFLLPGLLLWTMDWTWRLLGGDTGLSKRIPATLTNVGGGWYRIALAANPPTSGDNCEHNRPAASEKQSSISHLLQTYYLNCPEISTLQNHPFTAAIPRSHSSGAVFLFQKSAIAERDSQANRNKEWTWRLANYVDQECDIGVGKQIDFRVEGPYHPRTIEYESAQQIICVVGGTGFTGACSLALWWLQNRSVEGDARFLLVWTIKRRSSMEFPEWRELEKRIEATDNMRSTVHVSSEAGRVDISSLINKTCAESRAQNVWVYSAGPEKLLDAVEDVCTAIKSQSSKNGYGKDFRLTHYASKYES